DPRQADPDFRLDEFQHPWLVGGFHHEWAPGVHTLLLAGRLVNDQRVRNLAAPIPVITRDPNDQIIGYSTNPFDLNYRSEFEAYLGEFNQIFQTARQTLILGARVQRGAFKTTNSLTGLTPTQSLPPVEDDFDRLSGYGYYTVEPIQNLLVVLN